MDRKARVWWDFSRRNIDVVEYNYRTGTGAINERLELFAAAATRVEVPRIKGQHRERIKGISHVVEINPLDTSNGFR